MNIMRAVNATCVDTFSVPRVGGMRFRAMPDADMIDQFTRGAVRTNRDGITPRVVCVPHTLGGFRLCAVNDYASLPDAVCAAVSRGVDVVFTPMGELSVSDIVNAIDSGRRNRAGDDLE